MDAGDARRHDTDGPIDEGNQMQHADGEYKPKMDGNGTVDTQGIDAEDAKKRKPKDNKADDMVWAAAEAKAMLALQEASGIDAIPASKSVFLTLKSRYAWIKDIKAKPDGLEWDIFIIASQHKVYEFFKSLHGKSLSRIKERAKAQGWDFNDELRSGNGWIFTDKKGIERIRYRQNKTGKFMHENDGYIRWADADGNSLDVLGKPVKAKNGAAIPWDATPREINLICGGDTADVDRIMRELHINIKYFAP